MGFLDHNRPGMTVLPLLSGTLRNPSEPDFANGDPRIGAVIVTYNNGRMLADLLADLEEQTMGCCSIVVADNSIDASTEHLVRLRYPGVTYIRMPGNSGSAGGFRAGLRELSGRCDFILTLDDDIRLPRQTVEALLRGIEELERRFGAVGAVRAVGPRHPHPEPTEIDAFAWRGTLIRVQSIEKAGLPDENYFLYADDTEYALRIRLHGFRFYWVPQAVTIERRPEAKDAARLFGRPVVFYREAFRFYYAMRNSIHVCRKYRRYRDLLRNLEYGVKMILFLSLRHDGDLRRPGAILRGMRDGFFSRLGRNETFLPR
jgi:rhamnopyranosyl-N-acetylglucosaminyl-diphospho-decaprenol beta-1,3/1,4-galactofuranosyltransferase